MMPIPWSKIRQYGQAMGWEGQHLADFHVIIRIMDDHMLRQIRGKNGRSERIRTEDAEAGRKS